MADFCAQGFSVNMGVPLLCGDMINDAKHKEGYGVLNLCEKLGAVIVNNEGVAIYVHEDDTWGEWYIEFRILCDMLEQAKYVDCSIVLREWYLKYILNKFDGTLLTKIHIQIFEVSHTIWDNDYEHFIEYMDIK